MDVARITKLAERYLTDIDAESRGLPNLSVYTRNAVSEIEASVYEPVMCLILQGGKITSIGDQHVELRAGDALVVSHDLPVVSRITKASLSKPYVAVLLTLDLSLMHSLRDKISAAILPHETTRSLAAWKADEVWLRPLARYAALIDKPMDAEVLGPAILREIHYRLMLSPLGGMLCRLLNADSNASRIGVAIHMLRSEFRSSLKVADLAQRAGMSPSSFHHHFKSVTGTTPLQFQKDLRLIEARMLLRDQGLSVSEAAYSVGFESPTHFSRDYSKKFGLPPSRERKPSKSEIT